MSNINTPGKEVISSNTGAEAWWHAGGGPGILTHGPLTAYEQATPGLYEVFAGGKLVAKGGLPNAKIIALILKTI